MAEARHIASPAPKTGAEESAEQLADLFKTIEKVLRAYRIYSPEHTTALQAERALLEKFTACLKAAGDLTVAVKPYEFHFEDLVIYSNTDKQENFSFRFHQDGIRRLTFNEGLTLEELRAFLALIRTDFESYEHCDDDMVTLLWKLSLPHISYAAVETFVDAGSEQERVENLLKERIAERLRDESPDSLTAIVDQGIASIRRHLKDEDVKAILELPEVSPAAYNPSDLVIDPDELIIQRMIILLFRVLVSAQAEPEFREVSSVMRKLVESLVRLANFSISGKIYGKLRELSQAEINPSAVNAELIAQFYSELQDETLREEMRNAMKSPKGTSVDTFPELAASLGRESLKTLVQMFEEVDSPSFRQSMTPTLAALGADQADVFSPLLSRGDSRLALAVLEILAAIGQERAGAQIKRAYHHSDPRIRARVLDILAVGGLESAKGLCLSALRDPHRTVRMKALHLLAQVSDRRLAKIFFDFVHEKEFDGKDLEEKKHLYMALARTGGKAALRALGQELAGSVLDRTESTTERRISAVAALATLATPQARALVEEATTHKWAPKSLREACENALKSWRGGAHG